MSRPGDEELDWDEVVLLMRQARASSRGYATYWEWPPDRALAELGVARVLGEYLSHTEGSRWASEQAIKHDPPDVLLISTAGHHVGVEVTELVDSASVQRRRHQKRNGIEICYEWAKWSKDDVARSVVELIEKQDRKLAASISSYDEVFVIVYTDEPAIDFALAEQALLQVEAQVVNINRAFFILSYNPGVDRTLFPNGIPVLSVPLNRL